MGLQDEQPDQHHSSTLEERKLDLESRRFDREIELREREVKSAEEEVEVRKKELQKPAWRDPIFVAVLAASIAFFGNVIVAGIQGYYALKQIHEKADSDLILEISKGDYQTRASNLRSLIDLGLIYDPNTSKRLSAQLVSGVLPNTSQTNRLANDESVPAVASSSKSPASTSPESTSTLPTLSPHSSETMVAERTVDVPHGDYAVTSNPSCSNPDVENVNSIASAIVANKLDAEFPELSMLLNTLKQTLVFPAGSPGPSSEGGNVAQLLAPTRSASCAIVAITLPRQPTSRVEVTAADAASSWAPCKEESGAWLICQIGWSAWSYKISDGVLVGIFKNWSGDRQRAARIRVFQ